MTLQELNHYFDLQEKLERAEEMLNSFIAAAYPGAQVLTGMPHTPGVSDKVGDLAVEIADLKDRIATLRTNIEREKIMVTEYIARIPDDQTRMIFRLRFLHGLTWGEVAALIGGRNTESAVKNICYRYLETCDGPGAVVLDGAPPDVL